MPRYFFSVYDRIVETDNTGTELPDHAAARTEAIRFVGELLRDEPEHLDEDSALRILVTDEDGARVFAVEVRATQAD